jgi:hypothetical protein
MSAGKNLNAFAKDSSGTVLMYTAAALAILLGMGGLAIDLGYWYWSQRDMQSAADSAAMSAALEIARGATPAEIEARARDSATLNGYQHGLAALVTINRPPSTGFHAGDNNYIEAIVQQDQSGFVSSMVHSGDMTIAARAVATLAGAPSCVIALNPTADAALGISGNTDVELDCGAQANSSSATAIDQTGGSANLTAENIQAAGGYDCPNCSPTPNGGMPPVEDPFAYLDPPTVGPCDEPGVVNLMSSFTGTIPPGVYCGGIRINGATVEFETGLYIVDGVGLQISGNAVLTNEPGGVTFFVPSTATGQGGSVIFIAGTASTTLSAPTTGAYDGILFYVDPATDPALNVTLIGGNDMALTGVIYAPSQHVDYSGNSNANGTWTAVIGDTVEFIGNSYLGTTGFTGMNLPLALAVPSLAE